MGSLIRNSEAASAVVQLVLFPLVFIFGSYMPIHSEVLNRISGTLPVRPFNQALMGASYGTPKESARGHAPG